MISHNAYVSRTVLAALLLVAGTVPWASAAEGPFEFEFCSAGQVQTIKHSESLSIVAANTSGTFKTNPAGGKFDNLTAQCMSVAAVADGKPTINGYCEWQDFDGDRLVVSFERPGSPSGQFRSISGSGKFQSMKVDGTFTPGRFPQRPGTTVNCTKITGRWSQP